MNVPHVRSLVFMVFAGFSLTLFAIIGAVIATYAHDIEAATLGYVIKIGSPDSIWRGLVINNESGRQIEEACPYYREVEKLAEADLYKYDFEVQTPDSNWLSVSVQATDGDHQKVGMITHPIGAKWSRGFCFEMPGTVSDDQPLWVRGNAEHFRRVLGAHQTKYVSLTPIPPFIILPLSCYKANHEVDKTRKECRLNSWPPPR